MEEDNITMKTFLNIWNTKCPMIDIDKRKSPSYGNKRSNEKLFPTPKIAKSLGSTSIIHRFRVASISNPCQPEGLCCLGYSISTRKTHRMGHVQHLNLKMDMDGTCTWTFLIVYMYLRSPLILESVTVITRSDVATKGAMLPLNSNASSRRNFGAWMTRGSNSVDSVSHLQCILFN